MRFHQDVLPHWTVRESIARVSLLILLIVMCIVIVIAMSFISYNLTSSGKFSAMRTEPAHIYHPIDRKEFNNVYQTY